MPKKKPEPPVRGTGNPSEDYLNASWERVNVRIPREHGLVERWRKVAKARKESLWQWLLRHVELNERK